MSLKDVLRIDHLRQRVFAPFRCPQEIPGLLGSCKEFAQWIPEIGRDLICQHRLASIQLLIVVTNGYCRFSAARWERARTNAKDSVLRINSPTDLYLALGDSTEKKWDWVAIDLDTLYERRGALLVLWGLIQILLAGGSKITMSSQLGDRGRYWSSMPGAHLALVTTDALLGDPLLLMKFQQFGKIPLKESYALDPVPMFQGDRLRFFNLH